MRQDYTVALALLTAVTAALPPLLRFWGQRGWQFHVRHLFVLSALVAVAAYFFAQEQEKLAQIPYRAAAVLIVYLGFVLAISSAVTFSTSKPSRAQRPTDDARDDAR